MDKKLYESMVLTQIVSKKVLIIVSIVLLLSNLMLSWFVVTANTTEKTIIVPTGFSKAFYVNGDEIDPVYIEQMTRYLAQLRWTYTERTVDANFQEILKFVDPSQFAALDAKFADEVIRIGRNQLSSAFTPDAFRVYPNKGTAVIRGDYLGYMGTQIVSRGYKYLEIQYRYGDGRFNVIGMKELVGTHFDDLVDYDSEKGARVEESVEVKGGKNQLVPEQESQIEEKGER